MIRIARNKALMMFYQFQILMLLSTLMETVCQICFWLWQMTEHLTTERLYNVLEVIKNTYSVFQQRKIKLLKLELICL